MGCSSSKAAQAPVVTVTTSGNDGAQAKPAPLSAPAPEPRDAPPEKPGGARLSIPDDEGLMADQTPARTPIAQHREDQVKFDPGSHSEIDILVPGKVSSRSPLRWMESCFSTEEISAKGSRRGVAFQCNQCFLMAGLKAGPGQAGDSYGVIDFAFYCMENGRVQVFELGELKYTHKSKYIADTKFQVRIVGKAVEFVVDDEVVYHSPTPTQSSLHFQATFNGHPCEITDLWYVNKKEGP